MAYLDSLLHPERAYELAQEQAEKYYNQGIGFQQPYMNRGNEAGAGLSEAMMRLFNPQELQSSWIEGYETSPYAMNEADIVKQQGLDALAATGMIGSTSGARGIQSGTSQIMLADRQKYLDDLMQKYLSGAQIAQGLYGTGANAAGTAGQYAMNMGETSGNNAANAYSAPGRMMGSLLGTGATLAATAYGMPSGGMSMPWSTTGKSTSGLKTPGLPESPFMKNMWS